MRRALLALTAALFLPLAASRAQDAPSAADVLEQRAREAAALISADPKWPDDLFDAEFLKAAPPKKLTALGKQLFAAAGKPIALELTDRKGPFSGVYDAVCEKDVAVTLTISVASKAPHSIVGLWYSNPAPRPTSLEPLVAELAGLRGKTSLCVWKLGGKEPEVIAQHEPEAPLAIGSAFKLYVLGALAADVAAGKRKTSEIVRLDARRRSLPTGSLQTWPAGTPVTLGTLACAMISVSDNTATDELLVALGRERVEAELRAMGHAHVEKTLPFLTTGELFRLKLDGRATERDAYLALPLEKKREFLAREVAGWALDDAALDGGFLTRPTRIEELEWFASSADLCRALDALRVRTESGPAAELRDVLAISRGLPISKSAFPWVGFKGGSEPGVLTLAYLLKRRDGAWFALAASWNDPAATLDEARFSALVQGAIGVLARSAAK